MVLKKLKKLSGKNSGENTVERINSWLEEKYNAPRNYTPEPSHSPSGLGTKCYRKIYYQFWKVDKDIPLDSKACRIFWTGDMYEDMLIKWLDAIGEHIPYRNKSNGKIPKNKRTGLPDPQFPIKSKKYRIRKGMIDNVAITDNALWIYEIKSKKGEKFNKLEQPDPEHLVQAGIYLKSFNELHKKGEYSHIKEIQKFKEAKGVRYLYVNKDTSEIKQFDVTKKDFNLVFSQIDEKIQRVNKYIDQKELPPKTPDYCYFCPYKIKCKKEWNNV